MTKLFTKCVFSAFIVFSGACFSQAFSDIAFKSNIQPTNVDSGVVDYSGMGVFDLVGGDNFGHSIAISGDTMVVGAFGDESSDTGVNGNDLDNQAFESGAAYVYRKINGQWVQEAFLKASNTEASDKFGYSVAISDNTIIVGAPFKSNIGAAYIFERVGSQWQQVAVLESPNNSAYDKFGYSVAIEGDLFVVGSPSDRENPPEQRPVNAGFVYVYSKISNTWQLSSTLMASNGEIGDKFGYTVAVSGQTIAVGAPGEESNAVGINGNENDNSFVDAGAVYVFKNEANLNWTQQAYIKASNTNGHLLGGRFIYFFFGGKFGTSIDLEGNTLVVGSPDENSPTFEPETQNSSIGHYTGAAYVFSRNNNIWQQTDFLKASNIDARDSFGNSVAIKNEVILVGAPFEDSTEGNINGDQLDNSKPESGAVYQFNLINNKWTQQNFIKTEDPEGTVLIIGSSTTGDVFGSAVALSEDEIVVGLPGRSVHKGMVSVFANKGIKASQTGLWFNNKQPNNAISYYVLPNNRVAALWYTFDNQGNPLWLIGTGTHDGYTSKLDVEASHGTSFPPFFNTNDVVTEHWGQFEISFSDCDNGNFKWMPTQGNGFEAGSEKINRLTNTPGTDCFNQDQINAADFKTTEINPTYSALWANALDNKDRVSTYVLANNLFVAIWYNYDNNNKPLWLLGIGSYTDKKATLDVQTASGANFPPNYNADDVVKQNWGTFEIEFNDCGTGKFSWNPIAGNGYSQGSIDLARIEDADKLVCEIAAIPDEIFNNGFE